MDLALVAGALVSATCALRAARRDGPGVAGFVRERQRDRWRAAAASVLATSERLASSGRVELGRGALASVVLPIRAGEVRDLR
jgi:hypothetical protein